MPEQAGRCGGRSGMDCSVAGIAVRIELTAGNVAIGYGLVCDLG